MFWLVSYEKKNIYKRENYLIGGIETLIWNKFIYKIILEWIHVILKQYTQRKILFILSRENNQIPKLNKKIIPILFLIIIIIPIFQEAQESPLILSKC